MELIDSCDRIYSGSQYQYEPSSEDLTIMSSTFKVKQEVVPKERSHGEQPCGDDCNQSNNQSDDSLDVYAISTSMDANGGDDPGFDNAIYYVVDRSTPPPDEQPATVPCEETKGDDGIDIASDKNAFYAVIKK